MTTITLPPEIEGPLREEAQRRGTSPETLAIETLRDQFMGSAPRSAGQQGPSSLADFLDGYVGVVDGSGEANSEDCGKRFQEALISRQAKGAL
ncbi:MAG: hypothetical protein U0790_20995 [Isosphaeraceae bacterium]